MANLFPFPYADSTKTANGITYTVNSDKSINVSGTATADSQFYVVEASDPIELGPGYYTLQGTGDSDIQIALISVYTPGGTILYIPAGENDANFTLTETKQFHAQIGVPSGTTADLTVAPGLVKTGDLTTIDAENAKQIRKTMDVIIQVTPEQGEPIVINNSNLISCTVSLRSDLSIIEPTLPESEINIEAYFDDDISDVLASIPDETPVTYQAGYPGDMSPVRNFYLAEQITWQDNVMSIHAVDAIHKLDTDSKTDIGIYVAYRSLQSSLNGTTQMVEVFLYEAGISYASPDRQSTSYIISDRPAKRGGITDEWVTLYKQANIREIIAKLMQYLHQDLPTGLFDNRTSVWFSYIDAGIPTVLITKPEPKWDIYEEDAGDVKRNTDRNISQINVERTDLALNASSRVDKGSGTWIYGSGVFLQYGEEALANMYVKNSDYRHNIPGLYENDSYATSGTAMQPQITETRVAGDVFYLIKDIPEGIIYKTVNDVPRKLYNQVVPWNARQQSLWESDYGASVTDDQTVRIIGVSFSEHPTNNTYGSADNVVNVKEDILLGRIGTRGSSNDNANYEIYPSGAYNSILSRSPVTGSFTWKGDPRMQPRDVATFHRLDGTTEEITLENITITHEGGGTSAEITYRKGIC